MVAEKKELLKFQPFLSTVEVPFWQRLNQLKLNRFKLSDEAVNMNGYFELTNHVDVPARLCLDEQSFSVLAESSTDCGSEDVVVPRMHEWRVPGRLINTNTLEDFKIMDKNALLNREGQRIWDAIVNGSALLNPSILSSFFLCTFADLKKHSFYYWFAFPALIPEAPYFMETTPQLLSTMLSDVQQSQLLESLLSLGDSKLTETLSSKQPHPDFFLIQHSQDKTIARRLSEWENLDARTKTETMFAFVDPCPMPSIPGWPLRNFLMLITKQFNVHKPVIVCFREKLHGVTKRSFVGSTSNICKSMVFTVSWGDDAGHRELATSNTTTAFTTPFTTLSTTPTPSLPSTSTTTTSTINPLLTTTATTPTTTAATTPLVTSANPFTLLPKTVVVGWELNKRGKMGPRYLDLSPLMDPIRLAETSMDLNLKLMRWRQLPTLNTDLLAHTKCLLLGAGTLGCNTARVLLGWGLRTINFVDNALVGYSNPVRQPLFEFVDCKEGGKSKAEAAAEALKRIFPGVNAKGYTLSIPMPGHAISSETALTQAKKDFDLLEQLIEDHDVVFLGTDTRESRWLPTVICAAKDKLVLNTALGFDSYLVMRHGGGPNAEKGKGKKRLGCYFCSDVMAPDNSLRDRTLDQMCTVTRPGLAPIASSLAVELMVGLIHSSDKQHAEAPLSSSSNTSQPTMVLDKTEYPLGLLPHQIRGFLSHFSSVSPTGEAFDKCTACSKIVVDHYLKVGGFELMVQACNSPAFLEHLTGLDQLRQEVEDFDFEEDDDDVETLLG